MRTALDRYVDNDREKELLAYFDSFVEKYPGEQWDLIQALRDKMEHMCIHIGSPSSIIPMVKSIVSGKLKMWASHYTYRGDQLKMCEQEARRKTDGDYIKGHFRWNYGNVYIANYATRNYLQAFFIDKTVNLNTKIHSDLNTRLRYSVRKSRAVKHSDTCFTVEIETFGGNEFRYHYYQDKDLVTAQHIDPPISDYEKMWVKRQIKDACLI